MKNQEAGQAISQETRKPRHLKTKAALAVTSLLFAASCAWDRDNQRSVEPSPSPSPTIEPQVGGTRLGPQPAEGFVWVTVTPEARPIETATPVPVFENTKGVELKDALELQAVAPGVSVENIPLQGMTPRRIAGAPGFDGNKNDLGYSTKSTLADPGVVSVYRYEESETNPSAVLMTGRNEGTLLDADARPQELDLPANGFMEMTFAYGTFQVGEQILKLEDLGPNHSHVLVIQGDEGDDKQNTDASNKVRVSDYDPGKLGYKILAVPLGAGSFKSLEDTLKTVIDAHGVSISSKGDGGSSEVTLTLWTPVDEQTLSVVRSSHETDQPKKIEKGDLTKFTLLFKNWD